MFDRPNPIAMTLPCPTTPLRVPAITISVLMACMFSVATAFGQRALIVNAHDGSIEDQDAAELTSLLHSNGYHVTFIGHGQATWDKVKPAMQGVDIFIYSGHGSTQGYNDVGGLCLDDETNYIISSFTLEEEVQLAPEALVLFKSVCLGAGSNAGDMVDIGKSTAMERVTSYSKPFFNIGASGYYADNRSAGSITRSGGGSNNGTERVPPGIYNFLTSMFEGQSLQQAFHSNVPDDYRLEHCGPLSEHPELMLGITSDYTPGYSTLTTIYDDHRVSKQIPNVRSYDVAVCGVPGFRLDD